MNWCEFWFQLSSANLLGVVGAGISSGMTNASGNHIPYAIYSPYTIFRQTSVPAFRCRYLSLLRYVPGAAEFFCGQVDPV